ncbi:MAG: sigma-70 family RNA polymerase sigma factor [Planctomycetes bacterium]|nr:sigma-70 family RNA polymerase sigma factor [Planctomycetota bacterium]
MTPDDPDSLLLRARHGEAEALGELLVRSLPQLEAYLRLQAGAAVRLKESLSDLVQSVCGEVLADLPKFEFRGEGQFRHWLCKHALHKVINKREFYGAQKRDMAREVPQRRVVDSSDGTNSVLQFYGTLCTPSRVASGREQLARFEAAFDKLEPDYREAISLQRIVGLDYAEIAEAMGRSEGAVRNLVYRGLSRLAKLLSDGDDAPK